MALPGTERITTSLEPQSAWDLLQTKTYKLSVGCPILDSFLNGGLRLGITEIAGESGTGKTQLALQLLIQVQLPPELGGLNGAAVYISTEGEVPLKRLRQLVNFYHEKHAWTKTYDFCDNMFMKVVHSLDQFLTVIHEELPRLCREQQIRLIVIDSMAAIFRAEEDTANERSSLLFTIAHILSQLSAKHGLCVVVINQVSDGFQDSPHWVYQKHWAVTSSGRPVLPALGLTWANCVKWRLFLCRSERAVVESSNIQSHVQRSLCIIGGPDMAVPAHGCALEIFLGGIRGIDFSAPLLSSASSPS